MIVKLAQLSEIRRRHKRQKIVLGTGVFDLIHVGHLDYLTRLHSFGDIVVVLVNGDDRTKSLKDDSRPVIPESDRALLVDAIKGVDYVLIVPNYIESKADIDPTIKEVFEKLSPGVFATSNSSWRKYVGEMTNLVEIGRSGLGKFSSTTEIIGYIKSEF